MNPPPPWRVGVSDSLSGSGANTPTLNPSPQGGGRTHLRLIERLLEAHADLHALLLYVESLGLLDC